MPVLPVKNVNQVGTGQAPDRAKPVVLDETETALNIPGRGVVDHGVPLNKKDTFDPELTGAMNKDSLVTYDDTPAPPTPIPVYIVSTERQGRVVHDFRVFVAYAQPGQPTRAAGQHDARSRLLLKVPAAATNSVYVSDDLSTATAFAGYPVAPGGQLELFNARAIYCSTDSTASTAILVNLLEEFDVAS